MKNAAGGLATLAGRDTQTCGIVRGNMMQTSIEDKAKLSWDEIPTPDKCDISLTVGEWSWATASGFACLYNLLPEHPVTWGPIPQGKRLMELARELYQLAEKVAAWEESPQVEQESQSDNASQPSPCSVVET
jgi:hypothetical protein